MSFPIAAIDDAIVRVLAAELKLSPITARCLALRGIADAAAAGPFFAPRLAELRKPEGLAGLDTAAERIARAVQAGERIGVFGDYDVDGVTTAALLTSFLRAVGATVEVAVASREAGYGFTVFAAADFVARGCTLIITGDCGTSDILSVQHAKDKNVDTVIIDHHTVPESIDAHPAFALVNPFRPDSTFPFRGMASVGLAFYVVSAVRTRLRNAGWHTEVDPRELLDLVALGTVADLVPLKHENRILTTLGIARIGTRSRPGIAALLRAAGVAPEDAIDAKTIGWKLGPRLNAPGRLGAAMPSLECLLADHASSNAAADVLETANVARRSAQDVVVAEALATARVGACVFAAGIGWGSGVVGIVAAKLVDKYQLPAFVVAIDEPAGIGRGSARTTGGVDLYRALAAAASTMDRFGGHAAAAGFTVRIDQVDALHAALELAIAAQNEGTAKQISRATADASVSLLEITEKLVNELSTLAPFGQENPSPKFAAFGVRVVTVRRVGDGSHLKLDFDDGRGGVIGAIGFSLGERAPKIDDRIDILFTPMVSTWRGRKRVELELLDLSE